MRIKTIYWKQDVLWDRLLPYTPIDSYNQLLEAGALVRSVPQYETEKHIAKWEVRWPSEGLA